MQKEKKYLTSSNYLLTGQNLSILKCTEGKDILKRLNTMPVPKPQCENMSFPPTGNLQVGFETLHG